MNTEQRCRRCIIPKSAKEFKFSNDSCCELCLNQDLKKAPDGSNEKNIKLKIEDIKKTGKNRDYDCLVGLSGGRDSAYLLFTLVKKYNLRCMAAYHRTPFTPDVIDENVRKLTAALNVPLIQMDISNTKHRLFAKKIVNLWLESPKKVIASLACAPCKKHNHEVYKIAKKHKIGYIVFGGNKFENFQVGAAQDKKSKVDDYKEISQFQKIKQIIIVAKRGALIILQHPKLLLSFPLLFRSSILYLNNRTPYLRMRYSNIKMLDFYFIAGYDEKSVNEFLSEYNLKIPSNCNSSWRADCSFTELKNIMFSKTVGMTYNEAYLSNMVREGVITRAEALDRISTEGEISHERLKETCDILELSSEYFVNKKLTPFVRGKG